MSATGAHAPLVAESEINPAIIAEGCAMHDSVTTPARGPHDKEVQVHCDYISADAPIHGKFSEDTTIADIKEWARGQFVPNPPSDKAYYLNDDRTRRRFTEAEEAQTLAQLGYQHQAKFRLNEEQLSGAR